jgi:hypothetical protein
MGNTQKPESAYAEAAERDWFRLVSVRHKSRPENVAAQSAEVTNELAAKFAQLPRSRLWIEFSLTLMHARRHFHRARDLQEPRRVDAGILR